MLNDRDTQYAAGILLFYHRTDCLSLTSGEMVYSPTSESQREIDIVLDDGGRYLGFEVKDYSRRLGSPDVEQLLAKLKDCKTFSEIGVISSAGFNDHALNICKNYDARAFTVSPSSMSEIGQQSWNIPEIMDSYVLHWAWLPNPKVRAHFFGEAPMATSSEFRKADFKCRKPGFEKITTGELLGWKATSMVEIHLKNEMSPLPGMEVSVSMSLDEFCYSKMKFGSRWYEVSHVTVEGVLRRSRTPTEGQLYALKDEHTSKVLAFGSISIYPSGHMAIMGSVPGSNELTICHVSAHDRIRARAYKAKFSRQLPK